MTSQTNMQATKQPILVSEANPDSRIAQPLAVLMLLAFLGFLALNAAWYWFCLLFIATVATLVAVTWKAFIEPEHGMVREEARLFGKKLLRERRTPLKEFKAIVTKRCDAGEYLVGIRHRSGRKIWMRTCQSDPAQRPPGRYPESVAWQLSCDTGLEIEEYVPRRRFRWLRFFSRR